MHARPVDGLGARRGAVCEPSHTATVVVVCGLQTVHVLRVRRAGRATHDSPRPQTGGARAATPANSNSTALKAPILTCEQC